MRGELGGASVAFGGFDVSPVRDQFMYASETYDDWVILAPLSGGFTYKLTPEDGSASAPESGQCAIGDIVVCPPAVRLDRQLLEPSRFWFTRFDVTDSRLTPQWPPGKVTIADRQRLRTNFRLLDSADGGPASLRPLIGSHVLVDVLLLIGLERSLSARPADEDIVRGADYLESLVSDSTASIRGVATELGLSSTQFTRRFHAAYGVPPIRYLNELRLAAAQRMLIDTDESVARISADCGYSSPFYFSRVFRKFMGQSPIGYRLSRRV